MKQNILSILNTKKVMGLYIGSQTVDLVVLKGTFQGPKLIKFAQTPIYPKETKKEEIVAEANLDSQSNQNTQQEKIEQKTKDEYIIEAIQRLLRENDIKPGNVVSAISSEDTMVRYFQMPKIPKQEWVSAINFEAKRHIPFRMEDVISDFKVVPSPVSPNTMDVVFVAVRQDVIEHLAILLEKAGVKPTIVEPAPFSLIRAFTAADQISNKVNTAIVNIDIMSANINVLRNGVPYIIRDIPLREDSSSEDKSLEPIFEKLLAEIKLSFDFYEKQFPSEVIDKIIIYSHLPLENWHELVGKELQIPVEVGDPLRGIKVKKDVVPPKLAVCFGLALQGLLEPGIDINLCKERFLVHRRKDLFLKMIFLEASIAVFLLIVLKLLCMKTIAPLTNELDHTLSERPKVEVKIKDDSINTLESIKNKVETKKYLVENIMNNRTYFTNKLIDLAKLIPQNIWLTEVNFEEKINKKNAAKVHRQLNIKGYYFIENEGVNETDVVNNFLKILKEKNNVSKGMNKADIVSVERIEMDNKKVASFEILFSGS